MDPLLDLDKVNDEGKEEGDVDDDSDDGDDDEEQDDFIADPDYVDPGAAKRPPVPDEDSDKTTGPPSSEIHDLESIFWVLVWLCLHRSAPGTRRKALDIELPDGERTDLQMAVEDLFEGSLSTTANHKKLILTDDSDYASDVVAHITPFCQPLKPLLDLYRNLLLKEYKTRELKGIHDRVLDLFKRYEKYLQNNPPQPDGPILDAQYKEDQRRQYDNAGNWKIDPPGKSKSKRTNAAKGNGRPPKRSKSGTKA